MLVMSAHYFLFEISGILQGKKIAYSLWYQVSFRAHIFFGIVAIAFGPWQFLKSMPLKSPKMHKSIGYIYTFSVSTSSVSGLIIAQFAYGGWISALGFSTMAIAWFVSLVLAIKAIQSGHITKHMQWMYINYGLTFTAITQRTWLLSAFVFNLPFLPIYQSSAWIPWLINVSVAYCLFFYVQKPKNEKTTILL